MKALQSNTPHPTNEPVLDYRPGSAEVLALQRALDQLGRTGVEMGPIIDGELVRTGKTVEVRCPHNKSKVLGICHQAGPAEIERALAGAKRAWGSWSKLPGKARGDILLRAADLLAGKYRYLLNAATMLGQSKTCHQAEIDSACELVDFWRFNPHFFSELEHIQPHSVPGIINRMEYRALEGFVFAVTPFNFTAIGGNLPTSAALMGNVVIWKPATTALLSNFYVMEILKEAGLPDGVIQFLPGSGATMGGALLSHPELAGVHFTGSTSVFHQMWKTVGENIASYRNYPRLVGETGGKDFILAHPTANIEVLVTACIRGAFEYQGQKCSAASRVYVPKSLAAPFRDRMVAEMPTIRVGDVADFGNFMGAVIDESAYRSILGYVDHASKSREARVLYGGEHADDSGWFVQPTLIEAFRPDYRSMCEEIFGPVLTMYVYEDEAFEEVMALCDKTSPYALTGAIIAADPGVVDRATKVLQHAAGNFYINTKPTGAVVGQQPFGGSRASGTNDKAGSLFNLMRWTSVRTISETLKPPTDYRYPFLQ